MTNGKFISLGTVIWSVMKHGLCQELTYEEAAEYALEGIKLLGAPILYLSKVERKVLSSHKTDIPCDLLYIEGVKYFGDNSEGGTTMREATNSFHMSNDEFTISDSIKHNYRNSEFTYKIQKNIFFSSIAEGCVDIAYKGIATDEEGYPLIPDNQKVQLALEYYILSRYLEPLWLMGKVTDKAFEYIQQKRYFYMASAQTGVMMPTVDKMESLMNSINKLIINTTAHKDGFKKLGEKEYIKKYN